MKILQERRAGSYREYPGAGKQSYSEPAVGQCDVCGAPVKLADFTNTCDCGAEYNSFGQRLASRAQWGEETGESLADILGPGS